MPAQRVLSVGQCAPDEAGIRHMLTDRFDVGVDAVMFVDDAIDALSRRRYDLVLVNRLVFDDNSPGIDLIHRMRADPKYADIPVMMVSNYADAQAQAMKAGALRGFGKAELGREQTAEKLAKVLRPRA
jgi:CheY-like chemotaxis protein